MREQDQNEKKSRRWLWIIIGIITAILVVAAIVFFLPSPEDSSEDGETRVGLTWQCDCDNNVVVFDATRTPTPEGVVLRVEMRVFEHYETITFDWNATLTDGDTYDHQYTEDVPEFPEGAEGLVTFTFRFPEGLDLTAVHVHIRSCS